MERLVLFFLRFNKISPEQSLTCRVFQTVSCIKIHWSVCPNPYCWPHTQNMKFRRLGMGLKICLSNKFLNVVVAGLGFTLKTNLLEPRSMRNQKINSFTCWCRPSTFNGENDGLTHLCSLSALGIHVQNSVQPLPFQWSSNSILSSPFPFMPH